MAGRRYQNMQEEDAMGDGEDAAAEGGVDGDDEDYIDMVDDFDECGEEEEGECSFVSMGGDNEEDDKFDNVVGALENLMMDEEFQRLQNNFISEHCGVFVDEAENKLVYTDIFSKYTELIEGYVDRRLKEDVPGFDMQAFMEQLAQHEAEMESSDVFDFLVSLADFEVFKDIMLSHKRQKEGKDINLMLCVRTVPAAIHIDEQEDGEEFPDLELMITPVTSPKKIG